MDDFWVQTYTGQQFFFAEPGNISIIDIARALSRLNRFNGHTRMPLCVAEHSVVMTELVAEEGGSTLQQLYALLHDAHEAYIGDITRPLKAFLREKYGVSISALANDIQRTIYGELAIPLPQPPDIHLIEVKDLQLLAAERKLFMEGVHPWRCDDVEYPPSLLGSYNQWEPDEAMRYFESAFRRLHADLMFQERIRASEETKQV